MASRVYLKKGGTARLIIENFVDHDYVTIPAGFRIENITILKHGTTAGNIEVGTTDGGDEIVTSTALSGTDGNLADLTVKIKVFNADTKVYLDVSSAATGDISFQIQKIL